MTPPDPTRDEITNLREAGLTREGIALHFDVSVATVRRWIKEKKVPRPANRRRNKIKNLSPTGELIARMSDTTPLIERARKILGGRVTEKRLRGYYLDGQPASIYVIAKAAGLSLPED